MLRARFRAHQDYLSSPSQRPWVFVFVVYRGRNITVPLAAKARDFMFLTAEIDPGRLH